MLNSETGQDLIRGYGTRLPASRLSTGMRWLRDGGSMPRPISVHVDLTFRCTARCVHCAQWTWRESPEMTASQIGRLAGILRDWGVRTVTVGGGNPLLHKHFCHFLRLLGQANISVGVITEGGVTLDESVITALNESLSWIRFSLDGATAEVHDRIRGSAGLFDSATGAIRELCARKSRVKVAVNCVIQRRNLHQLSEMIALSERLGVDVLMFKIPHGEDPRGRYIPSTEQWLQVRDWAQKEAASHRLRKPLTNLAALSRLLSGVLEYEDLAAGRPVRQYYAARAARCYVPLYFLVIDAAGNVFPCDYLQADTRPESQEYHGMRSRFTVGNVFTHGDAVLDRLGELFRRDVHTLPGSGYKECGSCTRFFELNTHLSQTAGSGQGDGVSGIEAIGDVVAGQFL